METVDHCISLLFKSELMVKADRQTDQDRTYRQRDTSGQTDRQIRH